MKRLIVVPLRTENDIFGLLTLGRVADAGFDLLAVEVGSAGRPVTDGRAGTQLPSAKTLLERKLVERAKGIRQQRRRRLSEEQAYFLLRNNSRRRRIPMVNLAKEIIETYVQAGAPVRWQTA